MKNNLYKLCGQKVIWITIKSGMIEIDINSQKPNLGTNYHPAPNQHIFILNYTAQDV